MKTVTKRIAFLLILIGSLAGKVSAAKVLVPGGELVGLELRDSTVTVAAFDETLGKAAQSAGLKAGDRLVQINDRQIHCVEDVRQALRQSDGLLHISVLRGEKTHKFKVSPPLTDNGPKLGAYLKQGTTGVGTVTYYDPGTGEFAALGHGVNTQNGTLLQIESGTVYDAQVVSVKKGKIGTPGQLVGTLTGTQPTGTVEKNAAQGVFGTGKDLASGDALPVAQPEEIKAGPAVIRTSVDNTVREYSVEILKIYPNTKDRCRNMLLKVTDPTLLSTTGGIVQGMGVSYNRDNTGNPNSLRGFQVTDP